ncbi:hypothetical protein G6O67_006059 [Ophiocordyceps sinensis]|uniref:Uncharacterized protein n=2 Tax=Ophiocordyceps sinensis TaxID=72228 RepID=A0A8H4LXQ5_9HYPO|nr:hypothetical protein OCS_03937 [Ophiocordyceps sinensis CO18]KAF4507424.1 hypothetical protein G6O67_006059 [Ophiocordyceps sinensis]
MASAANYHVIDVGRGEYSLAQLPGDQLASTLPKPVDLSECTETATTTPDQNSEGSGKEHEEDTDDSIALFKDDSGLCRLDTGETYDPETQTYRDKKTGKFVSKPNRPEPEKVDTRCA